MSSSVGHNSLVMAVGTAASRLTGQIRTILLAAAVGTTGMAANAYQAGSMIPQVIFTLISGGIFNAVLVPQIVRTLKEDDAEDRLNKLITFAIALLAGITLAMMLLTATTPAFTHLYANGGKDMLALTNAFALWCMPQIFFYGLYTVLGQILAAKNHFGMYAWSSVAANIVSCAGFTLFIVMFGKADNQPLSFWTTGKIMLTAGTWTLGVAVQAIVLFVPLFKLGLRYRWRWGVHGIGLRSMGSIAAWSLGIVGIDQLLTIISTRITTNAPLRAHQLFGIDETLVAGNATYQNAFTIYILPYSLIAVSVATAVFPRISRAVADNDLAAARNDLSDALRNVTLLMSFFSAVFVVLSVPISLALLPSISVGEAQLMSGPMIALSLSLPLSSSYLIIQRTFYAFEDGRSPFIFMAVQLSIQMITLLIVTKVFSPLQWTTMRGVAVTLAYTFSFPLLVWMLRKRFENRLDGRRIALSYIKATVAAVAAAIVGIWLRTPVEHILGAELTPSGGHMNWLQSVGVCVVLGIVIIAVYVGALWGMHTQELVTMVSSLKARIAARRQSDAAVVPDAAGIAGDADDAMSHLEGGNGSETTDDDADSHDDSDGTPAAGQDDGQPAGAATDRAAADNPDEAPSNGLAQTDTGQHVGLVQDTAVPAAVSTTPVVRMTTITSPASTRISRYGAEGTMKPQLGDTVINRYTLVSLLRDEPGIQAWKANDRVLARDCQLFIVTDAGAIAKVDAIASSLALSRNRRFTQVLQLQHRGEVSIIITAVDNGLSLTDYFHGPASGTLSNAAMRSILGETASAMRQLLVDGLSHYALSTDTIRLTANGVQLADATLSPMLADTSHAPEGLGAERLATRQLAAVLYSLITRTPSAVDTRFDLSKLGPDVPGEFRLICHRGLESDGNSNVVPMESLAELTALLGDWEPLSHLQNSDIALPSIDAECSIANASLKTPDPARILDFPQDLSSSFEQHSYAQAAQASVMPVSALASPDANSENADHDKALAARQQAIQQAMQQESAEWMKNSQAVPRNSARQDIPHPEVTDSSDYDFHDIAAAEVANIMAPSVPDPDNAIFPNFNVPPSPYTDTQATLRFDFARKAAKKAHRLQPPSVNESTSRIPVYDANGLPLPPGDESRRALENEQTQILAANTPVSRPPSFTPTVEPEKETQESYNPVTQDDVADEKLFGRFSTKVVAIVVVILVVAAAAGLALHSLSGGTTIGVAKQSGAWPSQNLDKVPFGSSTPTSDASASSSSGKTSVITEDKDASAVPTPTVPENNTPYSIDKQEFLTKPGGQDGYGYYMHLSEPESVYRFVVSIRSSGGTGYLYANTTADPTQGEQVAQFSFDASGTTDVKLTKTVKSQDFLMWVPRDSLPGNQLYINSVQLY